MRVDEGTARRQPPSPSPPRPCLGADDRAIVDQCVSLAMRAHSSDAPFVLLQLPQPYPCATFAFPGAWSAADWVPAGGRSPFGVVEADPAVFPSLRNVVSQAVARVNGTFLAAFNRLLDSSDLRAEVSKAMLENKRIIFTGHSSGGAIAVLATTWLLQSWHKPGGNSQQHPLCITFGSPLVGDAVLSHALKREDWDRWFFHFVTVLDIIPRLLLAPIASLRHEIEEILDILNPKSSSSRVINPHSMPLVLPDFFATLLRSAMSVSSYQACLFMGCTNSLMGVMTSFFEVSPYRPSGKYFFCTGRDEIILVSNSDAVMQLLFYCLQLPSTQQLLDVATRSVNDHWRYESKIKQFIGQNAACLDYLEAHTSIVSDEDLDGVISRDLELSTNGVSCLRAALQWDKQRRQNEAKINANYEKIREKLKSLEAYRSTCQTKGLSYYDVFKDQSFVQDFHANIARLDLAGLWDEILEMLRRNELPDSFQGRIEWVNLATYYRRLVEPLDIANYYRHLKNEDTGPYTTSGRPRRYKYAQKWREQMQLVPAGTGSDSCFWAVFEELQAELTISMSFDSIRDRLVRLEEQALVSLKPGELGYDMFLPRSSFSRWWNALPEHHRAGSCITKLMTIMPWNL